MKTKWNGWGDLDHTYKFKNPAVFTKFLENNFGKIKTRTPEPFAPQKIRPSRLDPSIIERIVSIVGEKNFSINPLDRTIHSFGKSYYDLIRLRLGLVNNPTDGVVYTESDHEIVKLLQLAREKGITIIPFGGGTTVVGGVEPDIGSPVVLTIDLANMNQMIALDRLSQLATFQAGILGPELERLLNEHGFSLGHFPQSFEFSTLGGWIATRSAGHKSTAYGKIENMVAALKIALPEGVILETSCYPATATGSDLIQLICGSEGRERRDIFHPITLSGKFYVYLRVQKISLRSLPSLRLSSVYPIS